MPTEAEFQALLKEHRALKRAIAAVMCPRGEIPKDCTIEVTDGPEVHFVAVPPVQDTRIVGYKAGALDRLNGKKL